MIKFIVSLLVITIIGLAAVLLVRDDPGFVLLRYHDYSVETTLAFAMVALIIITVAIHYCLKLIRGLMRLPQTVQRQSQNRRFDKSRRQLNQGLIDLAEGRFAQAETNLLRLVDFSESPLLHYLAAARAAQLQGKHDERDQYLKAAHDANPDAGIAIGVTQAELQLDHQQTEQALATLSHLHAVAPRHDYVLKLLARAYYELEDWSSLVELLPDLRRKNLFKEGRLKEMEQAGYMGLLHKAASDSQQALDEIWKKIPRALQNEAPLIVGYISLMNQKEWHSVDADQVMVKALDRQWNDRLIDAYGSFKAADPNAQLEKAEKWLTEFGHNENLLLALGRISVRARLWGKAQGYFEASIGASVTAAACEALAELFEQHLQQKDKAVDFFKRGLQISLQKDNENRQDHGDL